MAAPPKTLDAGKAPAALAALATGKGEEAPRLTRDSADPFLARLHVGLRNLHTSAAGALRWRAAENPDLTENPLWRLSPIITLAPLLGLLGTVERIMQPFHLSGGLDPASDPHSSGIAEALIATAPGLFIDTLYLLPYNWWNRRPGRLRGWLEREINHVELLLQPARVRGVGWKEPSQVPEATITSAVRLFHDF